MTARLARTTGVPRPARRPAGFGSVVAVVLLSIGSIVIVGLSTPGADRAMQNTYAVDSIRAGLSADAGVSLAAAALITGSDPTLPPPYQGDYDLTFEDVEAGGVRTVTVTARYAEATRVVVVELETN